MTGHTHRSFTQLHVVKGADGKTQRVREVRCPTTLQTPAELNAAHQNPGLWWHRVYVESSEIVWEGSLILYSGDSFLAAGEMLGPESANGKPVRELWYREKVRNIGQLT
jgi:hypothetical protein